MASPTIHLMWKEYRALRSLWLGILTLAAVLSLLQILTSTFVRSGGLSLSDIAVGAIFIGVVTASLFAIVSICIAFAGEAEDRTTLLLQQLAPTWRQLMCGKFSAIALGTATLPFMIILANVLMLLIVYLILPAQFSRGTFSITPNPIMQMAPWTAPGAEQVLTILAAVFCVGCLIAVPALCWSLVSRKVITATLASIFSILFLYPPTIILFQNYGGISGTLMWMFLSGVAILLSLMWHRGYLPPRAEHRATSCSGSARRILPGISLIATVGLIWLIVDWSARHQVPWTPVAAVVAGILLVGGLAIWLSRRIWKRSSGSQQVLRSLRLSCSRITSMRVWLIRSSALPPSPWRMTRMLLWKEAHHAAGILIGWTIIGVVVIQICIHAQTDVILMAPVPAILFMAVFCQECGLRAFRRELADGTSLFLAHRGIMPSAVWWPKIGFWAIMMTLVMTLWLYADFVSQLSYAFFQLSEFNMFDYSSNLENSRSVTHLLLMLSLHAADPWTETYPQRALEIALAFAACCFVSGFVAASCLRRPILSFAFAGFLSTLTLIATGVLIYTDIPFIATLWPVLLAWIVMSRLTVRQTLEQRNSWRLDAGRLATLAAAALLAIPFALQARVNAIPIQMGMSWPGTETLFGQQFGDMWRVEDRPRINSGNDDVLSSETAWLKLYQAHSRSSQSEVAWQALAILRSMTQEDILNTVPRNWKSPWSPSLSRPLVHTAIQQARDLSTQRQHLAAGVLLADTLRLLQSLNDLNCNSPQLYEYCPVKQQLLKELATWTAEESLTVEQLQTVGRATADVLAEDQDAVTMLKNRFYYFWWGAAHAELEHQPEGAIREYEFAGSKASLWQSVPKTERHRFMKLLWAATTIEIATYQGSESFLHYPNIAELIRQSRTTFDFDTGLCLEVQTSLLNHQDSSLYRMVMDTVAAERATLLIFELQGYRLQHGKFPESLEVLLYSSDLPQQYTSRIVQSPWTKTLFGYAPAGTGAETMIFDFSSSTSRRELLPADQPMLWSNTWPAAVDQASRELFAKQSPEADRRPQTTNPDAPPSSLERLRVPLRPNQILLQW